LLQPRRTWWSEKAHEFLEPRPFADPDAAARKLVEIANGIEAVQDGRFFIGQLNATFLASGGSGEEFRTGIERAVTLGWLWRHEIGDISEIH
jgi:hypothetical protein